MNTKITRQRLHEIIKEELNLINESFARVKSYASGANKFRKLLKKGDRAFSSDDVLDFFDGESRRAAKAAVVKPASKYLVSMTGTVGMAEFTGLMFALGIPALVILDYDVSDEGILRDMSRLMKRPIDWTIINNPDGAEWSASASQRKQSGKDHLLVSLVLNQDLANELYKEKVIGIEIMDWVKQKWRDIANAKQIYNREKWLEANKTD